MSQQISDTPRLPDLDLRPASSVRLLLVLALAVSLILSGGLLRETAPGAVAVLVVAVLIWALLRLAVVRAQQQAAADLLARRQADGTVPTAEALHLARKRSLLLLASLTMALVGFVGPLVVVVLIDGGLHNWWTDRTWAGALAVVLAAIGTGQFSLTDSAKVTRAGSLIGWALSVAVYSVLPAAALLALAAGNTSALLLQRYASLLRGRVRDSPGHRLARTLQDPPAGNLRARLAAVRKFLSEANDRTLRRNAGMVAEELARIAVHLPKQAMAAMAAAPEPILDKRYEFVRSWAVNPDTTLDDQAWKALAQLGARTHGTRGRHELLHTALAPVRRDVPPAFRTRLARRLLADVDERTDRYADSTPVWQLLRALGPETPGWGWCALGDLAAGRGDDTEAVHRYERARELGDERARPRLAHHLARLGHGELVGGDPAAAATLLARAVEIDPAPDHRALLHLARSLTPRTDPGEEPAVPDRAHPDVHRTLALAALARGATAHAADLLRRAASTAQHDATSDRLLLALIEGDDGTFAATTAELEARNGSAWTDTVLVHPVPLLTHLAALPELPSLLADHPELVSGPLGAVSGVTDRFPPQARRFLAHQLVGTAARAVDEGRVAQALACLAEADPFLSERGDHR